MEMEGKVIIRTGSKMISSAEQYVEKRINVAALQLRCALSGGQLSINTVTSNSLHLDT